MKNFVILIFALLLCITVFTAYATETTYTGIVSSITVNTAGEHTIILNGVTIVGDQEEVYNEHGHLIDWKYSPAIDIKSPSTKLTIILKDGTINTLQGTYGYAGIANNGVDLVIRCESAGEGHECTNSCGKLTSGSGFGAAGIGGNYKQDMSGSIAIEGGNITTRGGDCGAGIGGGYGGSMIGNINISGGEVTSTGGSHATGMGGGYNSSMIGDISISGGKVTTNGGQLAAAIGSSLKGVLSGNVTISGGNVTANSGFYSAGIGGGDAGDLTGNITISGGIVNAYGYPWGAGIGGGYHGDFSGVVTITGGELTAIALIDYQGMIGEAIGAGYLGNMTGKIVIDPEQSKLEVRAGEDQTSASILSGSPFSAKTELKTLLAGKHYVKTAPYVPVTEVPKTGDTTNLMFLTFLTMFSVISMTVISFRKIKRNRTI